ncbi:MAG: hypothetical protein V4582_03975 [Pseudomonadota bacterium]
MNLSTIALLLLTPLLVWRLYLRVKGMMARQRSLESRHWTGMIVALTIVIVLGSGLAGTPEALGWFALGSAVGVGYGIWGLRLTRFEDTPNGYFFKPNARLGTVMAMALAARFMYLAAETYVNQGSGLPAPKFMDTMLTPLAVSMVAAYFGTYSAGLLRWRRKLRAGERSFDL